jgi:PAS domain S-box-containing protein
MQNQSQAESQPENNPSTAMASQQSSLHSLPEMSTDIGMILQLADGSIQACNPRAEELLGLTWEQMQEWNSLNYPWQTIHADGSPFLSETHPGMVALQSGQPCSNVVMGFYQPNGELIWLSFSSQPLFQANASYPPYAVVTTFTQIAPPQLLSTDKEGDRLPSQQSILLDEITERKQAEIVLMETNSILRSVIDGTSDVIYVKDLQGRYIIANSTAADWLETTVESMLNQDDIAFFPPEKAQQIQQTDRQVMMTGESITFEEEIPKQGVMRSLLSLKYPWRDAEGNIIGVIGISRDISEVYDELLVRQEIEAELRESNVRRQFMLDSAQIGDWDLDLTTQPHTAYRSLRHDQIFGYESLQPEWSYEIFLTHVHPDDRSIVNDNFQQTLSIGTNWNFECRIIHPDGSLHWIWVRSSVYCDQFGIPIRLLGMVVDISDRKQTEVALQEQTKLLELIIDSIGDGLILANPQGQFVLFNQAAQGLFGTLTNEKSHHEWSSTYGLFLNDQKTLFPSEYLPLARAIKGEYVNDVEVFVRRNPNSTGRWVSISGYPIINTSNEITGGVILCRDITERKQAEEALQASENRFRQLTNSMPQMIWTADASGQLNYVSDQWLNYTGLTLEQTQGRSAASQFIHPDELESTYQQWQMAVESGTIYQTEMRLKRGNDDSYQWFLVRAVPIRDEQGQIVEWCGTSTDIDDRKRIEEELRQKNAILDVINESAPTPIFVKDREGRIIYANPATLQVLGKPASEVIGCRDRDLYPLAELGVIVSENDRRIMESGETQVVEESPDGIRTYLSTKAPYRNQAGEVIGLIGIANDISDRVQLERDRERILQQEQAAREAAEKANRIKDELLAVLSHELRSPLNPILGWSKLLLTGKVDASKTTEALTAIERNAKLQSQLIEDLLDVSRILQGKLSLNVIPVTLKTIIGAAQETVKLAAEAKNIQIQTVLAPNIGQVLGDTGRLQQILWNLLSNAVKFTPVGGRVEVRLMQINHDAQIQISDTGKGINPDFLPHVFEHFRQEDGATTRKFGGLGLGLAIVRQLVELHGGTVFVNSPGEGQGATFTVRLPLLKPATLEANDTNSSLSPLPVESLSLAGLRIIVVDDEPDSQNFIAFVLQQEGAEVIALSSAIDALKSIQQSQPDLLISDIGMPGMDGYMLIEQIRNQLPPQYRKLLAIALTAYAGEINEHQVLAAGYQKHLAKPVEPKDLVAAVIRLVSDAQVSMFKKDDR